MGERLTEEDVTALLNAVVPQVLFGRIGARQVLEGVERLIAEWRELRLGLGESVRECSRLCGELAKSEAERDAARAEVARLNPITTLIACEGCGKSLRARDAAGGLRCAECLAAALAEAAETNRRLNRRCQWAESGLKKLARKRATHLKRAEQFVSLARVYFEKARRLYDSERYEWSRDPDRLAAARKEEAARLRKDLDSARADLAELRRLWHVAQLMTPPDELTPPERDTVRRFLELIGETDG